MNRRRDVLLYYDRSNRRLPESKDNFTSGPGCDRLLTLAARIAGTISAIVGHIAVLQPVM